MADRLITLKSFHDPLLANVCGNFLEENGIRCAIVSTDLLLGLISPEIAPHGHINLDVNESDLVPALAMLQHAGLIPRFDEPAESKPSNPRRMTDLIFACEFCSTEITIDAHDASSIINCPNCLEYLDVPESS
jgi:hypothetical protein